MSRSITVIGMVACALALVCPAVAVDSEPLRLTTPLPPGLIPPTVLSVPDPPPTSPSATTAFQPVCFAIDIDSNGAPSNARLLESSGSAEIDKLALDLALRTQYRPASMHGANVAVRMLNLWDVSRRLPARHLLRPCTWDLYDANADL